MKLGSSLVSLTSCQNSNFPFRKAQEITRILKNASKIIFPNFTRRHLITHTYLVKNNLEIKVISNGFWYNSIIAF